MPLLDPDPIARPRVAGAAAPAHYEDAVRRAVERIRAGQLSKVVLAREVRVHAAGAIDPAPVLDALRAGFPAATATAWAAPAAFVGASPELLVRRDGARAQTVALAGTTRRSADPAVDDHLGEQLLPEPQGPRGAGDRGAPDRARAGPGQRVGRRGRRAGAGQGPERPAPRHADPRPARGRRCRPSSWPAGCIRPRPWAASRATVAQPLIPALEGLDRGWYAGAVGWTDLAEDGEFCVALRCALLRGNVAHLYAGCGIVADSVPAEELAESEVKLQALLPLLT